MTLSDKKHWMKHIKTNQCCESYTQEDVKKFIKELKEIYANCEYDDFDRTFAIDNLDELAGEDLI